MESEPTAIHRLFVGLPVPVSIGRDIIDWAASVLPEGYGRILSPDSLHLSVAFFGTATPEHRQTLVNLIAKATRPKLTVETEGSWLYRHGALAIDINSNSWSRYFELYPRWVPTDHFMRSILQIEEELGTHYERHNIPHITFARIPKQNRKTEIEVTPPKFRIEFDRICLYESHLVEGGSDHKIVAESRLNS